MVYLLFNSQFENKVTFKINTTLNENTMCSLHKVLIFGEANLYNTLNQEVIFMPDLKNIKLVSSEI